MLPLFEIIAELEKKVSNEEKLEWLKKNNSDALREIIRCAYDKDVEWLIPDSAPPWKKNNLRRIERRLYAEVRRLKIFQKGCGYDGMNKTKMEYLFISMLESIDDHDADLLVEMLTQKSFKNLPDEVALEYLNSDK